MNAIAAPLTLATIERDPKNKLIVELRPFNGRTLLDLRIHYLAEDGKWRPSPKGVSLRIGEIHNVGDAIGRATEIIKGLGR